MKSKTKKPKLSCVVCGKPRKHKLIRQCDKCCIDFAGL